MVGCQKPGAELDAQKAAFQLEACRLRAEKYPTDLQIRFELGQLYFNAGKFNERRYVAKASRNALAAA